MSEYQLYCFAQSGNAYRAALMLNLIGADWEPIWVDFFGAMVQRTPQYRSDVNEMGEAPVLVHEKRKLTQSGVILTYLAGRSGTKGGDHPPRRQRYPFGWPGAGQNQGGARRLLAHRF